MKSQNKNSRKCGDFPWKNKWYVKMCERPPRYFCNNCDNLFYTGKFEKNDDDMYDDVCPNCGGYPTLTFEELAKEYIELRNDYYKTKGGEE